MEQEIVERFEEFEQAMIILELGRSTLMQHLSAKMANDIT